MKLMRLHVRLKLRPSQGGPSVSGPLETVSRPRIEQICKGWVPIEIVRRVYRQGEESRFPRRLISRPELKRHVRYKVFDHTADTGITAYGAGVDEIFENAAYGMFGLMTDVDRVRPVGEVRVEAEAHDLGSLLVDWLSELLFIHEAENVFFAEFDVAIEGFRLTAKARGEAVDPGRHRLQAQVKAVTYHMLEVNPKEGYANIVFDI